MKPLEHFICSSLVAVLAPPVLAKSALARATAPSVPPSPVPDGGVAGGVFAFGAMMGLLVVIGIAVKLVDMKRSREDEAVAVQARISDALLMDPSLAGVPVTPTVHVPFRRSSPAVVTLTGRAPRPELHEAALRLVMREMSRGRANYRIEDQIAVDPHSAVAPVTSRHAA